MKLEMESNDMETNEIKETNVVNITMDNKTANMFMKDLKYAIEESKDHKTQFDTRIAEIGKRLIITVLPK